MSTHTNSRIHLECSPAMHQWEMTRPTHTHAHTRAPVLAADHLDLEAEHGRDEGKHDRAEQLFTRTLSDTSINHTTPWLPLSQSLPPASLPSSSYYSRLLPFLPSSTILSVVALSCRQKVRSIDHAYPIQDSRGLHSSSPFFSPSLSFSTIFRISCFPFVFDLCPSGFPR
jgi:hypothetical protein